MVANISPFSNVIQQTLRTDVTGSVKGGEALNSSGGFGETLSKAIDKVNTEQVQADESVNTFLTGGQNNLHETMIQLEKADISMRLLVQVRNKAVEAYREIMRMQI